MNNYRQYSDYLMHYGVKGMKWEHHIYADPYQPTGRRPLRGFGKVARDTLSRNNTNTKNGNTGNTSSGNALVDRLTAFGNDVASRAQERGNNAANAGEVIGEMLANKQYGRAFTYYTSLDEQTRKDIDTYVTKTMIPEAFGNGDVRLGRQRVEQGSRIALAFFNNPVSSFARRTAQNGFNRVTGNDIRINTDVNLHRGKRMNN